MSEEQSRPVSRRRWIGIAGLPAIAAAAEFALESSQAAADDAKGKVDLSKSDGGDMAGCRVFNIRQFGAKGDGKTLDTSAVQAAIDACTADRGGIVLVPAGTFLIAPIQLKSNVTLHIVADGTLLGSTDPALYQPAEGIPISGDHTMGDGNVGLIHANNAENITIEGAGAIDGQGKDLRANGLNGIRRCHLSLFYKCKHLTIRDVYMYQSSYHTCRIANSSFINIDGLRIFSRVTGNNDGFHFISSEYVTINNCIVRSQDDACALFGSCKYIMVTNSFFSTRWSVFRFGGGEAGNVVVSNCVMDQVFGCPIKLHCDPGSRFENMSFSNIMMKDVTGPISIGAGPARLGGGMGAVAATADSKSSDSKSADSKIADSKSGDGATPIDQRPPATVRNISFSNISGTVITKETKLGDTTFTGANRPGEQHSCIQLNCVEGHTIENISLSDIRLTFDGGGTAEHAAQRDLAQTAGEYFALGPMPAYGLWARNVRGLSLSNVRFQLAAPDLRPAVIFDKVQDATLMNLSADGDAQAESLLRLMNSADTLITAPRVLSSTPVFLRVEGADNRNIIVDGGDLTKADKSLVTVDGAKADAVKIRA
ncbi:MAG TPA: glycosyl hydrolase family 28 protein [Pirellulales bacterium]